MTSYYESPITIILSLETELSNVLFLFLYFYLQRNLIISYQFSLTPEMKFFRQVIHQKSTCKFKRIMKGIDIMVTVESVTIKVPVGMSKYLVTVNPETELTRNALLLYPYILNQTISHGRAAEILGIRKSELIDLYDKLGYSYFDMTLDDLDEELNTFRMLKKKETVV